jgi:hypothetical protein
MTKPDNGGFQIHLSGVVGKALRQLQREASRRGEGKEFASALSRIIRVLRQDPNAVGEPLYRLPNLRLNVRTIVIAPLAVDYAVSQDHPYVYIKSGRLLSARNR